MLKERDLERIERRWHRYERQQRHSPGQKAERETFMLADAMRVMKKERPGQRVPVLDLMVFLEHYFEGLEFDRAGYPDPIASYSKALKLAQGRPYRDVIKPPLSGRFLSGAFRRAIAAVLAGRKEPRKLQRVFRVPGSKNCSAEELAAYQPLIYSMAAEIDASKPNLDDPMIDPAVNNLVPLDEDEAKTAIKPTF